MKIDLRNASEGELNELIRAVHAETRRRGEERLRRMDKGKLAEFRKRYRKFTDLGELRFKVTVPVVYVLRFGDGLRLVEGAVDKDFVNNPRNYPKELKEAIKEREKGMKGLMKEVEEYAREVGAEEWEIWGQMGGG